MELLIRNAKVIDWSQEFYGDVYIKDGYICEIGNNISKNCEMINAEGLVLMPAFVDLHAHFREPGFTYKEDILSGSRAAVKGGYTTLNLMANTKPICSNMEVVNYVQNRAKEIGLVDVNQLVSITRNFEGKDLSHLDEIDSTVRIISEDGKDVISSNIMLSAMKKAKERDLLVMCHCEDSELSSVDMRLAEDLMTLRNIELAKHTGCKIHISHVSTINSMQYIIDAKQKGYKVSAEVTPHHLALGNELSYRVNPPIRKEEDVEFLIKAIKDGYLESIGTDHAPHSEEDKLKGAPGISGIETAFALCYTSLVKKNHVDMCKLSEIMSKNPAITLGINKGQIKIGFEADLVLVDINKKYIINSKKFESKGKNTPFNSMEVQGDIVKTFKKGKVVYSI